MLGACASTRSEAPARLTEGTWTGDITPMNHPEMRSALLYQVSYEGERLNIVIEGADGQVLPTREANLRDDELTFVFTEPEANMLLTCSLERQLAGGFAGRCSDPDDKWARFTMIPPGA